MNEILKQIAQVYGKMAKTAHYRPAAPGDGMGNVSVVGPLPAEAATYASVWWEEEDSGVYNLGYPDYQLRPALIYIVEAARCMNGMDLGTARKLLRMAGAEMAAMEEGRSRRETFASKQPRRA